MDFGGALQALKAGKRVQRAGWNGKGMWLYHVPAGSWPTATDVARRHFGETVPYGPYIAMVTVQGNVVPWLASQADVLADDWSVVGDCAAEEASADATDAPAAEDAAARTAAEKPVLTDKNGDIAHPGHAPAGAVGCFYAGGYTMWYDIDGKLISEADAPTS